MQCALCKKEASLVQSHIIPKLVFDRIRTHPQSRFRSLDNPSKPLQAGEVHKMLCHDCEERFSGLERLFSCQFLDPLMENGTIPIISSGWLENYQFTVAWRTLADELSYLNKH